MSWLWFAVRPDRPPGTLAVAEATTEDGENAGYLAAWPRESKRPKGAMRIDSRAIDPSGEPALVSLVLAPRGTQIIFDDPAVVGATRAVLSLPPVDVLSTLVVARINFGGAVTALRDGRRWRLEADPFACFFERRILRVGAGLLGRMPQPTGPGTQRYGAGNPWPWDRFPE